MNEEKGLFSLTLRKIRKEHKLTLRKLAETSETSHSYLSQLENNRVNPPKPEMIRKIANGLAGNDEAENSKIYNELMNASGYISLEERKEKLRGKLAVINAKSFISETKGIESMLDALNHVERNHLELDNVLKHSKNLYYKKRKLTDTDLHAINAFIETLTNGRSEEYPTPEESAEEAYELFEEVKMNNDTSQWFNCHLAFFYTIV